MHLLTNQSRCIILKIDKLGTPTISMEDDAWDIKNEPWKRMFKK